MWVGNSAIYAGRFCITHENWISDFLFPWPSAVRVCFFHSQKGCLEWHEVVWDRRWRGRRRKPFRKHRFPSCIADASIIPGEVFLLPRLYRIRNVNARRLFKKATASSASEGMKHQRISMADRCHRFSSPTHAKKPETRWKRKKEKLFLQNHPSNLMLHAPCPRRELYPPPIHLTSINLIDGESDYWIFILLGIYGLIESINFNLQSKFCMELCNFDNVPTEHFPFPVLAMSSEPSFFVLPRFTSFCVPRQSIFRPSRSGFIDVWQWQIY